MPFIIAGFLYALLVATTLALVGVICLARRRLPGRSTVRGLVGSLAGFMVGCLVAVLLVFAIPTIGTHMGATALVTSASLSAAAIGSGLAFAKRSSAEPS